MEHVHARPYTRINLQRAWLRTRGTDAINIHTHTHILTRASTYAHKHKQTKGHEKQLPSGIFHGFQTIRSELTVWIITDFVYRHSLLISLRGPFKHERSQRTDTHIFCSLRSLVELRGVKPNFSDWCPSTYQIYTPVIISHPRWVRDKRTWKNHTRNPLRQVPRHRVQNWGNWSVYYIRIYTYIYLCRTFSSLIASSKFIHEREQQNRWWQVVWVCWSEFSNSDPILFFQSSSVLFTSLQ